VTTQPSTPPELHRPTEPADVNKSSRFRARTNAAVLLSGAATGIVVATVLLFLISWILQPESVRQSSLLGMLPFAAVLAIVAAGQTLVIQQGGIDLSVPGVVSLTVVIVTHYPNGDASKLPTALLLSLAAAIGAGLLSGLLVSRVGIAPIVTTLGMNSLLYGEVINISGGTPRTTTANLQSFATSKVAGIPTTVIVAIVVVAIVALLVKRTVIGRRFEGVGASAAGARAAGLIVPRYKLGAYVAATVLYWAGGVLLAGVVSTPSSFQGDGYLLPSVAAVVLGGTSLLGGRGSVAASAVGALFLTQLNQFLLTTGASTAVQSLVQAAALVFGIAIYTVPWRRVRGWLNARRASGEQTPVSTVTQQ
jgi:ribose transport system permease protein